MNGHCGHGKCLSDICNCECDDCLQADGYDLEPEPQPDDCPGLGHYDEIDWPEDSYSEDFHSDG